MPFTSAVRRQYAVTLLVLLCSLAAAVPLPASAAEPLPVSAEEGSAEANIVFPVELPVDSYADTWGAPRGGGRSHEGTDVLAPQMREVYAATSGEIIKAEGEECVAGVPCDSYYLAIAGDDGRGYFYVHLNNDTPGRPGGCDGIGGVVNAFSPRLVEELRRNETLAGVRVDRGELLGWVGSSGNAACGVDQLHFEIWNDHDWGATGKTNPYPELVAAEDPGSSGSGDAAVEAPDVARPLQRDAGPDRIATAVALSAEAWDASDTVVLAAGDRYTDALVAGPLASILDAPLLLVPRAGAPPSVLVDELDRLDADRAVVVGDIHTAVVAALTERTGLTDATVERVTAPDQYSLSAAVADLVIAHGGTAAGTVVAAGDEGDGGAWPDALMGSLLAGYRRSPVLLTHPASLPASVRDALVRLGAEDVTVVGGTAAVGTAAEADLDAAGLVVRRLAGPNRLQTALAVLDELVSASPQAGTSVLHLATAGDFPDALAAAPTLVRTGSTLVIMDRPSSSTAVLDWVSSQDVDRVHAIGGAAALPEATVQAVLDEVEHGG